MFVEKRRCNFSFGSNNNHISEKFIQYHDMRWCKPEHRDRELYAMLILEGMQASASLMITGNTVITDK